MQVDQSLTGHEHLSKWRAETPGCVHRNHLNNAGAALMPTPVINAIHDHLEKEALLGGYEAADAAGEEIEASYQALGQLIGSEASNIAIVENATVATSQALSVFDFNSGDTIITTNVDYSSNQIMLLNLAKRFGVEVIRAEDVSEGGVDPDSVRSLIQKHKPRLVLMSWVPTNSGLVQDAHAVGEICDDAGVPFLLDACQAVGQIPVDVAELRCDFLAATARKFLRGPRGIGFLYVSDRMLEQEMYPMYPDMRGAEWTSADEFKIAPDAKRFENWEFPYALVLGLGAAAEYADGVNIVTAGRRAFDLAAYTRQELSRLPNMHVLDRGENKCAIVTAGIDGLDINDLVVALREENINTSASNRNYGIIDMDAKELETALRISPHYYNTVEEIDQLINVLEGIV